MKRCRCGKPITKARVEFLQATKRPLSCIQCSQEASHLVLMEYSHKTAGELIRVPDDPEQRRRAVRAYNRSR